MSRTHRDHPRVKRWRLTHDCGQSPWRCNHHPEPYPRGERNIGPVPSWWNREQRQMERARARDALRTCRDWDELPISDEKPFHREWFW